MRHDPALSGAEVAEIADAPPRRSRAWGLDPRPGTRLVRSAVLLLCVSSAAYCAYFVARTASGGSGSASYIEFRPNPVVVPVEQGGLEGDGMVVDVFNTSDRPAMILGMKEFCSSACYYGSGLPLTIPARGTAQLSLRIHVNDPGPIAEEVEFFTSDEAHPVITLNVVGNLREAPASHAFDKLVAP
jgi:hypothetical protein